MTWRVHIDPEAEEQLVAAYQWWIVNRVDSWDLLHDEFEDATSLLATSPKIGGPYPHAGVPGLRRLLLSATRYHVYYSQDEASKTVFILAVWSAARGRLPPL